ncbi:autotransporter outer membrane beta-barrel domain-containing protein [Desulfovibrio sp. OttesenSCG-928-I05]|nr:autotransporter outer membrane beta-barrel domain-containing protein [Desulfovibrio sp. OttesenSCG-928-I05]
MIRIADSNTVTINGGTVLAPVIYGGLAVNNNAATSAGMSANNNTITIASSTTPLDLSATSLVGGGLSRLSSSSYTTFLASQLSDATYTGNTLEVKRADVTVANLINFQKLNFYVPDTFNVRTDSMLSITENGTVNIDGATVCVGIEGGGSTVAVGDKITLIDASRTGVTLSAANLTNGGSEGMVGVSKKLTFDLTTSGDLLRANILTIEGADSGGQIGTQLKSLTESRVSGIGMLTQGADMLATQGIPQLRASAGNGSGPAVFGVMGGQSLRYNSGSHVDVDGFNLATGLGWNFALNEGKNGNLLLGAFFESGWGSYDSHNSFSSGSVKGDGDTEYYGGGILARYDTAPIGPGNIYLETSFRAGKVESDYSSSDFLNSSFTGKVDFDSSSAYYGAHAGIGYIWNISEASSLDMYTKYLWTRQDSDSVTIEGDSIRFKAMDSHRWRTGAKFSHALATDSGLVFTPYVGAAYEHEFDSKARATANGDAIDAPDVKGGTGIGELGFSFKPSATSGFSVDLGMQGYTGKREGVGGSFQLKFEF